MPNVHNGGTRFSVGTAVVITPHNLQNLARNGAPARTRTWDPRLRRPSVGSVINRRLSPTSPRWSGFREFTPILAALRRFIASHAITDRRDDQRDGSEPGGNQIPTGRGQLPHEELERGAGRLAGGMVARRHRQLIQVCGQNVLPGPHPEPAMRSPCSLGRVPTSVTTSSASCARPPAIIEDLHTIADLRDPDQIRRDSDAGATRWPRGGAGVGRFHASREREVP